MSDKYFSSSDITLLSLGSNGSNGYGSCVLNIKYTNNGKIELANIASTTNGVSAPSCVINNISITIE